MTPWWSQDSSMWIAIIGGAGGGTCVGLFGALMGVLAPRGIGRVPMLATHTALVALGIVALGAGIFAASTGQPYHVYYPLLLGGGIATMVLGGLLPVARLRYRQAEQRRMDAEQFRRE